MTQEEKQLLLIDLCARLPYGLICKELGQAKKLLSVSPSKAYGITLDNGEYTRGNYKIEDIKPYLRPMSSMTNEEKKELRQEHVKDEKLYAECLTNAANGDNSMRGKVILHFAADWCNKNHFDFRGLIPMGLALEAPKDMYK